MQKRIVLIVNPRAGRCRGAKHLGDLAQAIQDKEYLPVVLLTGKPGDARRFACEHGGEADVVCCVGGDGTFSEVVSGMAAAKHSAPIGYIPAGSTNDYASSLGLSLNLHTATLDAIGGEAQSFDLGIFNGQPFAYAAAFGALARISYGTPQDLKNALGYFAYVLEGIFDLHSLRAEAMEIDTDDEHLEGEYLLGTISNAASVGGILQFDSREVRLNDGYFELLLLSKPATTREFAQLMQALRTRSYSNCRCLAYRRSRHVRIVSRNPIPWTLDGERAEEGRHAAIETIPNAIRVIVPRKQADLPASDAFPCPDE